MLKIFLAVLISFGLCFSCSSKTTKESSATDDQLKTKEPQTTDDGGYDSQKEDGKYKE